MTKLWMAIISVCSMIIGLWKAVAGRVGRKRKRMDEGKKKAIEGVDEEDTSKITSGLDEIRRNR